MARTASAQVGQPIVEIQLDQEGRVVNEPAVIRLIETRVGDRLSVKSARETIAHLMSLSRYEDVQVFSEPVSGGVRVKYVLIPQHPIDRVEFTGTVLLSRGRPAAHGDRTVRPRRPAPHARTTWPKPCGSSIDAGAIRQRR